MSNISFPARLFSLDRLRPVFLCPLVLRSLIFPILSTVARWHSSYAAGVTRITNMWFGECYFWQDSSYPPSLNYDLCRCSCTVRGTRARGFVAAGATKLQPDARCMVRKYDVVIRLHVRQSAAATL